VQDAIDLLINSQAGTTAFCTIAGDTANLALEVVFILEAVADPKWNVEQFLAPLPLRIVVDVRGGDLSLTLDAKSLSAEAEDGDIHRFLERPGFNTAVLKALLDAATELAQTQGISLIKAAETKAIVALTADLQRLTDLHKVNDHVRPEEIEWAREQRERCREAINQARIRLDSIRLVLQEPRRIR
jgi:ATP-dependent helicase HepA